MSYIEDKKSKKKNSEEGDSDFSTFALHAVSLIVFVVISSFFSALFMQNITLYGRSPLQGTKLYGPPYVPSRSFYGQHGGKNVLNTVLNMSEWSFPYKNFFTKPFPKTEEAAKNNWWWRIGSWVTMSIAYSFANGRLILQELFSALNSATTSGKFAMLKTNLLFITGQYIITLLVTLLPFYSILSTMYALGKNAYKLIPNNLWIFLFLAIPILLIILSVGPVIVAGVTMAQFIMALLFFLVYPLINGESLAEIGDILFKRRNMMINQILFFLTLLAFYDLDSTKGLVFLIVFLGFLFKVIA